MRASGRLPTRLRRQLVAAVQAPRLCHLAVRQPALRVGGIVCQHLAAGQEQQGRVGTGSGGQRQVAANEAAAAAAAAALAQRATRIRRGSSAMHGLLASAAERPSACSGLRATHLLGRLRKRLLQHLLATTIQTYKLLPQSAAAQLHPCSTRVSAKHIAAPAAALAPDHADLLLRICLQHAASGWRRHHSPAAAAARWRPLCAAFRPCALPLLRQIYSCTAACNNSARVFRWGTVAGWAWWRWKGGQRWKARWAERQLRPAASGQQRGKEVVKQLYDRVRNSCP